MPIHRLAADLIVVLHLAFVAFVILSVPLVWLGRLRGWRWTRRPAWRLAHLAAIGYVVLMTWLGLACPLTVLENHLRQQAGQSSYPGSFIGYWAHEALFFDLSPMAFAVVYSAFGLAVLLTWWWAPPRFRSAGQGSPPASPGA